MKTIADDQVGKGTTNAPPVAATRSQRRPVVLVAAVLMILLGAAGGAFALLSVGNTVEAVAARVPIERGQELSAEMFTTVQLNPDPQLRFISPEGIAPLVGRRAGHDIAAGSLVGPDVGVEELVPPAMATVVGLSLPPGAEPGIPLAVGDRVRVVLTEPAYACGAGSAAIAEVGDEADSGVGADVGAAEPDESCLMSSYVIVGEVVSAGRDEASGQVSVSVQVSREEGPRAAAAAAMGRAAVVLDSREG